MNKFTIWFFLANLVHISLCSNVEILYSPNSIILQSTTEPLLSSDYSKFVALCLGYSVKKPSNWDGFYGYKNLNVPMSVITFHMPSSLQDIASQVYKLEENSIVDSEFDEISNMIALRNSDSWSDRIQLFENNKDGDSEMHKEIDTLNSYIHKLEKGKSDLPEHVFLWFDFKTKNTELKSEIKNSINRLRQLFDDQVMIVSLYDSEQNALKRKPREVSEETLGDNMAPQYSMDFPAAFVSIAFTTILLLLTVFAVSVAMWHIDPGRDSIIYRLTSQKIKKDQ